MVAIHRTETYDTGYDEATKDNWSTVDPPSESRFDYQRKYNGAGLPLGETYQEILTLSRHGADFVVHLEKGSELVYSVIKNRKEIYLEGEVTRYTGSGN